MHLFGVSLTEPELIDALVFELVRGYTFEEVLEQVYKTEPRRLAISQVIIARAPVSTAIDPKIIEGLVAQKLTNLPPEIQFFGRTIKDVNAAFVRVPSWPVHLLFSHEHNHYLSANLNPTSSINFFDAGSPHFSSVIGNIQKAEIEIIVEAGRGRFPPIQGTLYEAPNGYLVPSFLRVRKPTTISIGCRCNFLLVATSSSGLCRDCHRHVVDRLDYAEHKPETCFVSQAA